jgi:hypothetical protein
MRPASAAGGEHWWRRFADLGEVAGQEVDDEFPYPCGIMRAVSTA